MTPPATAADERHARALRRKNAPPVSRRVSGPARAPRAALAGAGTARTTVPLRLGRTAMRVGDARVLDRLVRGRTWIALVAIGLMGIVFMQVSMLRLNAGISHAVTAADTLERQNSSMRADISNLDSGERIENASTSHGMVAPQAGDVHYLDAAHANPDEAAASIKPPDPVKAAAVAAAVAAANRSAAVASGAPTTGAAGTAATTSGAATATGAATSGAAAGAGATTSGGATTGATGTGSAATGAATSGAATSGAATSGAATSGATGTGTTGTGATGTGATGTGATGTVATGTGVVGTGAATSGATGAATAGAGAVAGGASAPQGG